MGEKEDDGNPFAGEKWLGDHRRYDAYRDGQLHPSPQTIKKIQTNFAEKVKEMVAENWGMVYPINYGALCNIIDNTLKNQED